MKIKGNQIEKILKKIAHEELLERKSDFEDVFSDKTPIDVLIKNSKAEIYDLLKLSTKFEIDLNSENWQQELISCLKNSDSLSEQKLSKQLEIELSKLKNDQYDPYFEAINNSLILQEVNLKGEIVYVNNNFQKLTGHEPSEVLGKKASAMGGKEFHPQNFWKNLWNTVLEGKVWKGRIKNLRKDNSIILMDTTITPIIDKEGNVEKFIIIRYDLSREEEYRTKLKIKNQELEELVNKDALTQVFNRRSFDEKFNALVNQANETGSQNLGLFLLDIDDFKLFNNNYGHQIGDEVLKKVGKTLKESLRKNDEVFRYGGEEFTILIKDVNDSKELYLLGEKLRKALKDIKIPVGNKILSISGSFGASIYEQQGSDAFLEKVDNLMYDSKQNGKNRVTLG